MSRYGLTRRASILHGIPHGQCCPPALLSPAWGPLGAGAIGGRGGEGGEGGGGGDRKGGFGGKGGWGGEGGGAGFGGGEGGEGGEGGKGGGLCGRTLAQCTPTSNMCV